MEAGDGFSLRPSARIAPQQFTALDSSRVLVVRVGRQEGASKRWQLDFTYQTATTPFEMIFRQWSN
jgi:hypothetical protein